MFNECQNLDEIIDSNISPVRSLAQKLNIDPQTMFQRLRTDYKKACEDGRICADSTGVSFYTDYAEITLIRNNDFSSRYPGYLKFDTRATISSEAAAAGTESCDEPVLPESLDAGVWLNRDNLIRLNQFAVGREEEPSEEILSRLKQGYLEARTQNKLSTYQDSFTFQTGLQTVDGVPIIASIKPARSGQTLPWSLNYVGYDREATSGSAIKKFAVLGDYLKDISALAKPEKWFFGENCDKLDILKNYIAHTFFRLQREKKICINQKADFAAFNTGIATASYDDIYICFRRRHDAEGPAWKYAGVCTAAHGNLGKQLIQQFNPLPQPADYISRKEDVIFDVNKSLYLDAEHILIDRIDRLPPDFLQFYLGSDPEAARVLDRISNPQCMDLVPEYEALANILRRNDVLFHSLCQGLQYAADSVIKRLRWNYRLAIPCYYPKHDSMSLLLPMYFLNREQPMAALVVRLTEAGNYLGHTLLPMDIAYMNARLISSQESSWLAA